MNRICIVYFFLIPFLSSFANNNIISIPLEKAVKDGLVTCKIKGYKNSDESYRMISIVVNNLKTKNLNLILESGRIFKCSDTTQQDVIVMQQELFALKASGSHEIPLFSMCIEMHNSSPDEGIDFAMGDMGNEKLMQMVRLVEKNKWFNTAGQTAVWCITDNCPLTSITNADTAITNSLRRLASKLTGQKMVTAGDDYGDYYDEPEPEPLPRISFKGQWEFSIQEPSHVVIALFDDQKKLIEGIVDEHLTDIGHYRYTFTTSAIEVRSEYYEVNLIINGKVVQTERYDM